MQLHPLYGVQRPVRDGRGAKPGNDLSGFGCAEDCALEFAGVVVDRCRGGVVGPGRDELGELADVEDEFGGKGEESNGGGVVGAEKEFGGRFVDRLQWALLDRQSRPCGGGTD